MLDGDHRLFMSQCQHDIIICRYFSIPNSLPHLVHEFEFLLLLIVGGGDPLHFVLEEHSVVLLLVLLGEGAAASLKNVFYQIK